MNQRAQLRQILSPVAAEQVDISLLDDTDVDQVIQVSQSASIDRGRRSYSAYLAVAVKLDWMDSIKDEREYAEVVRVLTATVDRPSSRQIIPDMPDQVKLMIDSADQKHLAGLDNAPMLIPVILELTRILPVGPQSRFKEKDKTRRESALDAIGQRLSLAMLRMSSAGPGSGWAVLQNSLAAIQTGSTPPEVLYRDCIAPWALDGTLYSGVASMNLAKVLTHLEQIAGMIADGVPASVAMELV